MLVSRPLASARNACVLRAGLSPVWLPVLSKHRTVACRMGISEPVKGRHRAGLHTPEYPPPYPCVRGRGRAPRPAVGCRIPGAPRPRLGSATSSQDPRARRAAAVAMLASRATVRRSIGSAQGRVTTAGARAVKPAVFESSGARRAAWGLRPSLREGPLPYGQRSSPIPGALRYGGFAPPRLTCWLDVSVPQQDVRGELPDGG